MFTKILALLFAIFIMVLPHNSYAQDYNGKTATELIELYKQSCDAGAAPNCYQLSLIYKKMNDQVKSREFLEIACRGGEKAACVDLEGGPKETGSNILFWGSILLFGLAVLIIAQQVFQDEDTFKAAEKLEEGSASKVKDYNQHGIILKYSRPFFKRYVSPVVQSMKNKKNLKEKYKRKLASAGLTDYLSPEDFLSFKIFLILGFPVLFFAIRQFLEETWPLSMIPIVGVIGYFYPDIWIRGKIKKRQQEIIMAMPFSVDMLALSVEAGLDFMAAITKVVEKAKPSPLIDEFEILLKEIKIGASRAEGLRNLSWRVDLIQVSSFCATLIAADSVGASIGPILKALSKEIREKRSSDVEKAGATAATKILFPMLFLIVPAVFIVVGAPLILETMMSSN